jgi:integrase
MHRVSQFPPGIMPPRKVRIYFRSGRFLLQWWEPAQRKNIAERVEGDLIEAVAQARRIEARLSGLGNSGRVTGKLRHEELVDRFVADLRGRAEAGEVTPATVGRYGSALRHYLAFVQTTQARRYPFAAGVDRTFALSFAAFLANRRVSPNGLPSGVRRRMTGCSFVWDAVRGMLQWATDPDRGNQLPDGFRNPFLHRALQLARRAPDLFGQPDITLAMAAEFLEACDDYQLRVFVPLIFFGLRAAEPCYLFREYVDGNWLRVPCNPALAYTTKGKRDKRLPLVEPIRAALLGTEPGRAGLLLLRRSVWEGRERAPLAGRSLAELAGELESRLMALGKRGDASNAARRHRLRDELLADAGGTNYDRLEGEFKRVAASLRWPAAATPKDFRHLFATSLGNAGMPDHYRKYLMGHAPGSQGAISAYTHLDRLTEQYGRLLEGDWGQLADVLRRRAEGDHPRGMKQSLNCRAVVPAPPARPPLTGGRASEL